MTINEKFGQGIIDRIKNEQIAPRPRWHFLLKDYAVWGTGLLALFIGGLSAAVFFYLLRPEEWGAYDRWAEGWLDSILLAVTSIWLLLLAVFLLVVNYNIKHTKKGYRYPMWRILAASVVGSLILGGVFYNVGIGQAIDDVLAERMPWYDRIANRGMGVWSRPGSGRLSGVVMSLDADKRFVIVGLDRRPWRVEAGNAQIVPPAEVRVGLPLRIVGSSTADGQFVAEAILPAGPGRRYIESHLPFDHMGKMMDEMKKDAENALLLPPIPGCGLAGYEEAMILERFPDLKKALETGITAHRESIRNAIEKDQGLAEVLKRLHIDPSVWE